MITISPLGYVTPDTDTPLYHLFLFLEIEKKDMHPPMTHVFTQINQNVELEFLFFNELPHM